VCVLSLEWKKVGVMDGESGDEGAGASLHGTSEWMRGVRRRTIGTRLTE